MSSLLTLFLSYILLYKYATLITFTFLGAFLLPLPLNTAYFAVGAFASQGYFNILNVWLVAYAVNVLSDFLGYFVTYRYGKDILKILHIKPENKNFVKVEKWLREYSGETIFFTRLTTPFASLVNFMSGLIGVPFKKFAFLDMTGNFIDVSFFVLAGYFLGNYWEEFLKNIQYLGTLIFIIFILTLLARIFGKKYLHILK